MTKTEIRAELRRSACEDDDPWQCGPSAFYFAVSNFVVDRERLLGARHDDLRMLYLLVAEAL